MRDVARAASEKVGSACETIFWPLSLNLDQFVLDVRNEAEEQTKMHVFVLDDKWKVKGDHITSRWIGIPSMT